MTAVALSEVESLRFGLRLARVAWQRGDSPRSIVDGLLAARVDIAVLRMPGHADGAASAFTALGIAPLHADTLVTYVCDLQRTQVAMLPAPTLHHRPATRDDVPMIERLVEAAFVDYPNHYSANPLLDPARARAGYAQWAADHIERSERLCWLALVDGQIAGLACSSHDAPTGECVGTLHGVHPDFSQRGIYTGMIVATLRHYAAAGFKRLSIATQAANLRVQRTWIRLGLEPARVEQTYHLSPLFGCTADAALVDIGFDPSATALDALARAHRIAGGDAASTGGLHLHWRDAGGISSETRFRSSVMPRRDGSARRTTLAQAPDARILGWAVSDSTP